MDKCGRPISEYRGEFTWNFKEGFSREGRRLKPDDRLSSDVRQLRLLKKKELAEEELKKAREAAQKELEPPVVVDKYGEEYDVCETAKEAIARLIKSDPRLASKYQAYTRKIDSKLKPYGTSYDNSFMKSTNLFPTVRAYEMAAEEFERDQEMFEGPDGSRDLQLKKAAMKSDWTSSVTNFGKQPLDYSTGAQEDLETNDNSRLAIQDKGESLRQKWVERAHQELSKKFSANQKATEEQRQRLRCEVPLWFRRGLERKGLIQ